MITAVTFVFAAGVGALVRTDAGRRWNRHTGIAWGTLVVNVTGSFLLGLLHEVSPPVVTVIGVGGLGTFTTFSSFARDVVALAEERQFLHCLGYVALTCALGIAAAAIGIALSG